MISASLSRQLVRLLNAFRPYYTVRDTGVEPPFAAEALFRMHDERFFLVRQARIADFNSNEHVFFALSPSLDPETYRMLEEEAWKRGLSRVVPENNHRNSDITLVILTEELPEDTAKLVKKAWRHKSYTFGLRGWSNLRVIACDCLTGRQAFNRLGDHLQKVVEHSGAAES